MTLELPIFLEVLRHVVAHVYDGLADELHAALRETPHAERTPVGLAMGKAALAMARAFGPVEAGLVIAPHDDAAPLPPGWRLIVAAHPEPDERSLVAGDAAVELVGRTPADRVIVALISGGASALVEQPLIPLAELRRLVAHLAARGAPIADLNAVRKELSAIKGGKLALHAAAPIVTLAISDVIGDDLETIGSGPTVGWWHRDPARVERRQLARTHATAILHRAAAPVPPFLRERADDLRARPDDRARVVVPMARFGLRFRDALAARFGDAVRYRAEPITAHVVTVAQEVSTEPPILVLWGEPVVHLPRAHGEGGRMQQLALELAWHLQDLPQRRAFAIGSDGCDGPPPRARPAPAGAWVTGDTWHAIARLGLDPEAARQRCDAGTALAAVDRLIVTGPTGINHADLVVIG